MTGERGARILATLALVGIGALYAFTSARHVLGGDNGELVAAAFSGGIAHPPGYPLYVLLLSLARVVPASSPAHAAALITAAIATMSIAALAWAARGWGASRTTSVFAAAFYAVTPLAWILGTHAEVFALNVLLAMGIVGLAGPERRAPLGREDLRAFLLALFAGLGLSNHHSIVLLAPIGLYAFVKSARQSGPARAIAFGALGLALGLLPYASIAMRAASLAPGEGCAWGSPRGLSGLFHHFLRRDYGTFSLGIMEGEHSPLAHAFALMKTIVVDLYAAPVVLLLALLIGLRGQPLGALARRHRAHVALLVSLLLVGPIFTTRFNLSSSGLAAHITERFHLLPLALVAVLLAPALDVLLERWRTQARAPIAFGALFVARALTSHGAVAEHHRPTIDLYVRNVLTLAPPHAIILHSGDDRVGGFMYARCALGLRPDVDAVVPVLLLTDWYPKQASARLGIPIVHGVQMPGKDWPELPSRALVEQLVSTGRPLVVTDWFGTTLDRTVPSYPLGPLIHVARTGADVPDPHRLLKLNEEAFDKLQLESTLPEPDTWAGARMLDYARPWNVLANAFAASGDAERAELCKKLAKSLTP